uniref:Dynamin-type G domain-containing protein n=1 Tax=Vitis vinifera TaxID=29760 RepID=A5ACK8_VITVI|nr:hypothetical protein VITISV_024320 [Vitis vinifera]
MTTMESLIGLVNRIQRACTVLGDYGGDSALPTLWEALPSVAVVGGQSSGKSSVLESIVGRDFLPRGSGIVTRRPLVLQLHKTEEGLQEYAEFLHLPKRRFTDFSIVRKEIQDETDRMTGRTKQISPLSISMLPLLFNNIYLFNLTTFHHFFFPAAVVNLTLIDLPGLTKVAVEGQPESIVQDIENMVRSYIEKGLVVNFGNSPELSINSLVKESTHFPFSYLPYLTTKFNFEKAIIIDEILHKKRCKRISPIDFGKLVEVEECF